MNLVELWWTGVTSPRQAFDELGAKPAPLWGFWVVLIFNLAISVFTLFPRYLLGSDPLMPSALTFLPTEQYLLAEIFFLVLSWSMILTVIGLRQLLNVERTAAWGLILLSTLTTLPFLALFAR